MPSLNAKHWGGDFDCRTDAVFQDRIKPFIEKELRDLALFDEDRAAWAKDNLPPDYVMTYRFADHARRVAADMKATALHLGLSDAIAENLYWAMLPHDIGKRFLPVDIWDRMDKPDDALKALRRSHTDRGFDYIQTQLEVNHPFLTLMLDIMHNHHEQMDGKGHRGVKGKDLSLPVRLACIVESFDGYATARPHFGDRDISVEGVLNRMRSEKGADVFDMELFEAFAEVKIVLKT